MPTSLLVFSVLLVIAATLLWSPWLGGIATILALGGLVWIKGGWPFARSLLPAFVLLAMLIPPPLNYDQRLTLWLRGVATSWSSHLLDAMGLVHALSGNIIEIPKQRLLVEEACSGINSVLSTSAACLFYTMWRRRHPVHIFTALTFTLCFIILGNVVRITVGAWLIHHHHIDILSGRKHQAIGLVMFICYLLLILSLDQFLLFLGKPVFVYTKSDKKSETDSATEQPVARNPQPASSPVVPKEIKPQTTVADGTASQTFRLPKKLVWVVGGFLAILGAIQIVQGVVRFWQSRQMARIPESALIQNAQFNLPEQIGDWRAINKVPLDQKIETLGIYSKVWHYQRGGVIASVALDYPFTGYHDVTECYTLGGWQLRDKTIETADESQRRPSCVQVALQKDFMKQGALWFSTMDEFGRWQDKGETSQSFKQRFTLGTSQPTTYRVQVLVTSFNQLKPEEKTETRKFFEQTRDLLAKQLLAQMRKRA